MNVADLIAKAEKASPTVRAERKEWSKLYPAFATLRSKGFDPNAAIQWLIDNRAMSKEDKGLAYNAFAQIKKRKDREGKK